MADLDFKVRPPLRCCRCGDLAVARDGLAGRAENADPLRAHDGPFVCATHRRETDEPILPNPQVRRCRFVVEVHLAAAKYEHGQAMTEAWTRLEAAIVAAGGTATMVAAGSQVGRYGPGPGAEPRQAKAGIPGGRPLKH